MNEAIQILILLTLVVAIVAGVLLIQMFQQAKRALLRVEQSLSSLSHKATDSLEKLNDSTVVANKLMEDLRVTSQDLNHTLATIREPARKVGEIVERISKIEERVESKVSPAIDSAADQFASTVNVAVKFLRKFFG